MTKPILYVKTGCPYCKAAEDYLNANHIAYERRDVRGDAARMDELEELSGQTKTPTMRLDGDVLADFGMEQLEAFLASHQKG